MTNRISEIKAKIGSGARPNKFMVYITFPQNLDVGSTNLENDAAILCKASSIPDKTIGVIEVWNQGRKYNLPGDTTFTGTWDCTFYNTEEHNLRRAFLAWQKAMDHAQTGTHTGNPASLQTTMKVAQMDSAENETVVYELHNVYPTSVATISLDQAGVDQLEEYNVTFSYSDWVIGDDEDNDQPAEFTNATKNDVALNN